mgnify:CR=1 FL=1
MKKRKIIHSALSLSLTAALCLSMAACGGTQTPADSVAASQPSAPSAVVQPSACCGDDLCGTACEGLEPQAGGGKPLHGQERCKHSSRRLQHRFNG